MKILASLAFASLVALAASPASATIQFIQGPASGSLSPVHLQSGPLDNVVTGTVGALTAFFQSNENIANQGASKIVASDGDFRFLSLGLQDPTKTYTAVEFNLDAATNGFVTLKATDQFGTTTSQTFAVSGHGQNFFNIKAINGEIIKSVQLATTADLRDVGQVRFGGFSAVPETASWGLMIFGLGGVGAMLRSRRRRSLAV